MKATLYSNEIMPIDFDDDIEFVLVSVFDQIHRGLFILIDIFWQKRSYVG